MLEHRQQVLDGIRERLGPHGFEPEVTYSDWLLALQRIAELSTATEGEYLVCTFTPSRHSEV
jgi:hypothetical protein